MRLQPIFDVICIRFAIASLIVINLAIASLDSAIARFAVVLRDRAKSDLAASGDSVADNVFANLMHRVLVSAIIGALASTGFATFGIGLTVSSSRAAKSHDAFALFGFIQFFVSIGYVALGGLIADILHGYQSSFERFSHAGEIPYYEIMYYGGVGEAAFGALVMVLMIVTLFA
ncbi:hypothetical protein N7478_010123 [Penicillium angulare]|uniref:uncharacterized protein n=1 Tax=Penicillium angulare TaxID=116970 RepID=UPI00254219B7|nr:uncharacterized protein N7478_010123 [Penicillium angulare]KAJ5267315.1 hypothetical protein N7478_010123 [Penicillium angulare]